MKLTCFIFRYSILPGLSLDGILAVDIIEGSFTSKKFARFIDSLLDQMNPFPGPNSVIIMDNCRIHKSDAILDMIQERYVFTFCHDFESHCHNLCIVVGCVTSFYHPIPQI